MVRRRQYKRPVRRSGRPRRSYTRRPRVSTRRTTYRRRVAEPCKCPGELTPGAKFAMAQLDPFEPKCLGAKIPDSNTMPSISNQDIDQESVSSGTAGQLAGVAFCPNYQNARYTAVPGTSLAWTTAPTQRRNFASVTQTIEAYRPVAHAIRISSGLAPTAATGFLHIGLAVEASRNDETAGTAVPDLPKSISDMTGLAHYKRVTISSLTQSPMTIINKWIDETAFRYNDVDSTNSFFANSSVPRVDWFNFNQSWAFIVIVLEGAPVSQPVLAVEHLLTSEMLPKKEGFLIGTQAAPHSSGTMSAVSSMVQETDFGHTEAQQDSYIQQGINELARGAAIAGAQVYNNIAAPLLQRVGHSAVNTAANYALNAVMGRGGIPGVNANPNRLALT